MRTAGWLVLLWAAAAQADVVNVAVRPGVPGKSKPALLVRVLAPVRGFHVRLRRNDGESVDVKDKAGVGQERAVALPQPDGKFHWEGELVLTLKDGSEEALPLSFDTELWGPPALTLDKDRDVDLGKRTLRFQLNRPAVRAVLEVYDEAGALAWQGEFPCAGQPAGAPLQASWGEVKGEVLRIALKVIAEGEAWAAVDLFPYTVQVPHEEVVFDTGKSDIRPDQLPRLAAPLEELQRRVARARRWADVRLYVAGHTDTVGDAASNHALSHARARAIGQYFRKQGLPVPILVEGHGEDRPRVPTPDETPEERNRRVDYILSVGAPYAADWKPL